MIAIQALPSRLRWDPEFARGVERSIPYHRVRQGWHEGQPRLRR